MSKRIEKIASYTKGFVSIVDIGCDHGLTIVEALKNYGVKKAYALDINEEPLERAKINIKKNNLSNKVSFLLSDGLINFNQDFDLAIISGMGGNLIVKILAESIDKFRNKALLLSPQSDNDLVRLYLANNNFKIIKEEALIDKNKYYEIILAIPGKTKYNSFEILFGPQLLQDRNKIFLEHYDKLLTIKKEAFNKTKDKEILKDIYLYTYLLEDKMNKHNYYKTNYYTSLFIDDNIRDLIVIFPGGGYEHTSNREAENVGLKLNALGYNAIVFHYRETLDTYDVLYPEIAKAINSLDKKNVAKIYFMGFSAGGHLACHLANHLDEYNLSADGLILCYPVISTKPECIHEGSFNYLLGEDIDKLNLFSEELNVSEKSPKLFIWHTTTDQSVSVLNSIYLIEAYKKNNINFEAHFYNSGGHGLSLATKDAVQKEGQDNPHIATWFKLLEEWLLTN